MMSKLLRDFLGNFFHCALLHPVFDRFEMIYWGLCFSADGHKAISQLEKLT